MFFLRKGRSETERPRWSPGVHFEIVGILFARSYGRRFAVMATAVLLRPVAVTTGHLAIAAAIVRHAGGRGRHWGWNHRDWRSLDDDLRRGLHGNVGRSVGFFGRLIGGGPTAYDEKRSRET